MNYEACNNGKIDEVKYLLPKSNLDVKNEKGETTLISGNKPKKLIDYNRKHLFFIKLQNLDKLMLLNCF